MSPPLGFQGIPGLMIPSFKVTPYVLQRTSPSAYPSSALGKDLFHQQ